MAKKSFIDSSENPALAYISKTPDTEDTQKTENTVITENTQHAHVTPKRKEIKNKRVNFVITPSLHQDLTIIAHMQRTSLNELINRVMGEYAAEKHEQIDKYLTLVGDE